MLPERRKLQPGEGQGEPVNAALAWLRRSCRPRVRWPGSVRQSGESYQTALCCGRAKLSPELQPSPSGNPRQGAREQGGQVSRMEIYKGCSASEARQAVGSNSSVVNIRTRRAVHTFTVWSGMLSSTGKRHALCAYGVGVWGRVWPWRTTLAPMWAAPGRADLHRHGAPGTESAARARGAVPGVSFPHDHPHRENFFLGALGVV